MMSKPFWTRTTFLVWLSFLGIVLSASARDGDPVRERKLAVLSQIYREAEDPDAKANQRALREEFLERSAEYLDKYPNEATIWLIRADIALKLDKPHEGWEAGKNLTRLGLDRSDKEIVKDIFIQLERKKWLEENDPAIKVGEAQELARQNEERARAEAEQKRVESENARNRGQWERDENTIRAAFKQIANGNV